MKEKFIFIIRSDNRPGLLAQILPVFTRRRIELESINTNLPDPKGRVLIMIVAIVQEEESVIVTAAN